MSKDLSPSIIDETVITNLLKQKALPSHQKVKEILAKSLELKGLTLDEVSALILVDDEELLQEIFHTAQRVKEEIYGKRLVIFAPLYISNYCTNECLYCAFRQQNKELKRRQLTQDEIADEVHYLIEQGQKRILLVAGETYSEPQFQYILDAIATVYKTKSQHGEIRRVNVNIAPLTLEDFHCLKEAAIGTYQVFQETYHPETYKNVHTGGKKADYLWRLTAPDRAITAGIDDVGIGVLFGLADWRFEILALLQHIAHLHKLFGIGPHTISVPRLEPASGSTLASSPPEPVSDLDFCKIIAILRLAIPYTGIILSTRETAELRHDAFSLGISQISAGSRTNPGGYSGKDSNSDLNGQFSLGDHRSLDEVVQDVANLGYIPSFCTACYRSGRTGDDFMALAKNGRIKKICHPNALFTFQEYLSHYASPSTRALGEKLITKELAALPETERQLFSKAIEKIKNGALDVFV
jgi:2-iminoacetate synthase